MTSRRTNRVLWAFAMSAFFAAVVPAPAEEEPEALPPKEAILEDARASARYLELELEREKRLLDAGDREKALSIEADCLRHEIKCLERYLWYVKRDKALADRTGPLETALTGMKGLSPEASLQQRRDKEFAVSEMVADPLGLGPGEEAGEQGPEEK